MNSTDLEILVKLKDEASASFKQVGNNIAKESENMTGKLTGVASGMGMIQTAAIGAGLAAAGLVVAFGVSAVKDYAKAQAGLASIDATLQSMGKSAVGNKQNILDASDAALKFGFDNDDAARSITRFYQATGDLNQATKLNNIAMDLARAKNLDLATAASLVNQVLGGNGRVLRQYQINLKDSATPLEALGELQQKVAGQAQGFAETFPGQMEVMNETWNDMKKAIGKVLVDALLPFIKEFTAWLTDPKTQASFKYWTAQFQSWAEVIIPVVIDTFKLWFNILQTIFDILLKIGEAIMSVVDRAGKMASAVGNVIVHGSQGGPVTGPGLLQQMGIIKMAQGGVVTQPTMALIGEAGPEAIIPLSDAGDMGGGGVSIHIGSLYGTDQAAAIRFANEVARVLGNQLKLRV